MNIAGALTKRVLAAILMLLAVIVLNFLLIQAAPGDAVDVFVGESGGADEEVIALMRDSYGLDEPIFTQLVTYVERMAVGNLGHSFHYNQPVLPLIAERIPATVLLSLVALLLAVLLGTYLGVLSALRPNASTSHFVTIVSLIGFATPAFWFGMMVLILLASYLPIFPAFGMRSVPAPGDLFGRVVDVAHHLVLPGFTLSLLFLANYTRLARASMLDVLGADYVRTARAKGLREWKVIYKHALKNAAIPIVTMAGLQFGHLLSGALIVETVFSWPGMGPLAYDSILRRDYPVVLGTLFIAAVMVVVANLLTDLLYRVLDPRIGTVRDEV